MVGELKISLWSLGGHDITLTWWIFSGLVYQRFVLKRCTPNGEVGETMCSSLETRLVDDKQLNKIDGPSQKDSKDLTINQSVIETILEVNLKL